MQLRNSDVVFPRGDADRLGRISTSVPKMIEIGPWHRDAGSLTIFTVLPGDVRPQEMCTGDPRPPGTGSKYTEPISNLPAA